MLPPIWAKWLILSFRQAENPRWEVRSHQLQLGLAITERNILIAIKGGLPTDLDLELSPCMEKVRHGGAPTIARGAPGSRWEGHSHPGTVA
jgi:hypothetical protein